MTTRTNSWSLSRDGKKTRHGRLGSDAVRAGVGRRQSVFALASFLCVAVVGGISCEEVDHVVVTVNAAADLESNKLPDTLHIMVAAEDTGNEVICGPQEVASYPVESGTGHIELPFTFEIKPGSEFDDVLYVRIEGKQGGAVIFRTDRMASLSGGDVEFDIVISNDCVVDSGDGDISTNSRNHCYGGEWEPSPYADVLGVDATELASRQDCLPQN